MLDAPLQGPVFKIASQRAPCDAFFSLASLRTRAYGYEDPNRLTRVAIALPLFSSGGYLLHCYPRHQTASSSQPTFPEYQSRPASGSH